MSGLTPTRAGQAQNKPKQSSRAGAQRPIADIMLGLHSDAHQTTEAPWHQGFSDECDIPCFYGAPSCFLEMRRHCIALNGSFFNTHRMIQQDVLKAHF